MNPRAFDASTIQSAHFCEAPAFSLRQRKRTGRKAEGIRFETKAQAHLEARNEFYLASPWIIFISDGKPHWCQPDGICIDVAAGIITIVEIKYSHTAEAYRQLRQVYAPVLGRIFPPGLWTFRLVELVKWFDPSVVFPESVVMCPDPFTHRSERIGVHIWRPHG